MDIVQNKFNYEFDSNGQVTDVIIGLTGNKDRDYLNSNIIISQEDLASGTSFLATAPNDLIAIAKKKLEDYVANGGTK